MTQARSSKKILLGSVALIVLAAVVIVGIYLATQGRDSAQDNSNSVVVGAPVNLDQTPNFAACSIVNDEDLRAVMQNGIQEITEGARAGIVSPNTNTAEQCVYEFTTPLSENNSLKLEVFSVSAEADNEADILDASWSLDIDAALPSFYKLETNVDGNIIAYLRVINAGQNIQWTLTQPVNAQQFNLSDMRFILLALSERADYAAVQQAAAEENDAPDIPPTE